MAEKNPSPTGCNYDRKNPQKLVQSENGLEHHLQKLPPQLCAQFSRRGEDGRAALDLGDWDTVTRAFEDCRKLLKDTRTAALEQKTHDWLLVWADLPLAEVYQFRAPNLSKAYEIRKEMLHCVQLLRESDPILVYVLDCFFCTALYEWGCADNPAEKELALQKYAMLRDCDEKDAEPELCHLLSVDHFNHSESLEDAFRWILEAKRLWAKKIPGRENYEYLRWEAQMNMSLSMYEEAEDMLTTLLQTMDKPSETATVNPVDRSNLHGLLQDCYTGLSKKAAADGDVVTEEAYARSAEEQRHLELKCREEVKEKMLQRIEHLDRKSLAYEDNQEHKKAAESLEECLKLINSHDHPEELRGFGSITGYLNRLGAIYKELYRQDISSNVKALPHNEHLLCSQQYYTQCLERMTNPLDIAFTHHQIAELYEILDLSQFDHIDASGTKVVEHSKHASMHTLEAGPSSLVVQELQLPSYHCLEGDTYLATTSPLLGHGQNAAQRYADIMYTMRENLNTEDWTKVLEAHKAVYTILQEYNFRRYIVLQRRPKTIGSHMSKEDMQISTRWMREALLWAERGRTRALLYQLGPNMLPCVPSGDLRDFDTDDGLAWETLQCSLEACREGATFVEYSSMKNKIQWMVFVVTQDGHIDMTWTEKAVDIEGRLKKLRSHLSSEPEKQSPGDDGKMENCGYNDDDMNTDLEYLHELLIAPIADNLSRMKPEHKLVIIPNELLTNVPFSALRDGTQCAGQGYLIQSHTISLAPSLRVLKKCQARVEYLRTELSHNPDRTAIVALGNPAYRKDSQLKRLETSAKEVEFIESLFGSEQTQVVKLLGPNANPKKLLDCAKESQTFIHMGAYSKVDSQHLRKGALLLARPDAKEIRAACGLSLPDGKAEPKSDTLVTRAVFSDCEDDVEDEDVEDESNFGELGSVCHGDSRSPSLLGKGHLRSEDIFGCGFPWRTPLVVLSACDTSNGEITAEGFLNLPRAFMVAGVTCVVVSQWSTLDESTFKLMKSFYTNLKSGKDVASALRTSMLHMLDHHDKLTEKKVKEWAPFVVWGLPTVSLPAHLQSA